MTRVKTHDTPDLVLPAPWSVEKGPGQYRPKDPPLLTVSGYSRDIEPLTKALSIRCGTGRDKSGPGKRPLLVLGDPSDLAGPLGRLEEMLGNIARRSLKEQAYIIEVRPSGVMAAAGGEPGLFHAAITLGHLVSPEGALPCCSILDRPALARRAMLVDLSRGRVPRPGALRKLVDLAAALKYNQLTFNIEHVFPCPARPEIGKGHDPLTPDDLADLDQYAHERCVEIIPFQQSLGHMRGILSLPGYRGLAFDKELLWSLDPSNDKIYEVLSDLYDAQINATRSSMFHAGCDEPFDILKNFEPARWGGRTPGRVISDHLTRLHQMLSQKGRTMMAWADAVLSQPEALPLLPDDLVLCIWMYGSGDLEGPEHYRKSIEPVAERGLPFYACTSSWSLMKLFPDLAVMRANHDSFIPEAKRLGAMGAMITVWGDMGHMNLPGLEPYPLAYGARHFWEDAPNNGTDFDRAFSWTLLRGAAGASAQLCGTLDEVNRVLKGPAGMAGVGFLLLFEEPLSTGFLANKDAAKGPPAKAQRLAEAAHALAGASEKARGLLSEMAIRSCIAPGFAADRWWLDQHLPALQLQALATKLLLASHLSKHWPEREKSGEFDEVLETAAGLCDFAARLLKVCCLILKGRWLSSSKYSDLDLNLARYERLIDAWDKRAVQFRSYRQDLQNGKLPADMPGLETLTALSPSGYSFDMLAEMGLKGLL